MSDEQKSGPDVVAWKKDNPGSLAISNELKAIWEGERSCRAQAKTYSIPLVCLADHEAACEALRSLLAEASKLLKRSPPAAMGMYVGRDKKSFGAQAKELAGAIDAALVAAKGIS